MLSCLHVFTFEFCFLELRFPWISSANNYFCYASNYNPTARLASTSATSLHRISHGGRKKKPSSKRRKENSKNHEQNVTEICNIFTIHTFILFAIANNLMVLIAICFLSLLFSIFSSLAFLSQAVCKYNPFVQC